MLVTHLIHNSLLFALARGALTRVNDFGSNPAGIQMFIEVPTNVAAKAPILVAVSVRCAFLGP